MSFIFSVLPQNIRRDDLTNDAFHFVYAIARLEGVQNGKELYNAFWDYNKLFTYEQKDPFCYAVKYKDVPFVFNAGKTFSIPEYRDELQKMYFVASEEQKEKAIRLFDKELF